MKQETKKTVAAFVAAAIADPEERAAVLERLEGKTMPPKRDKLLTGREACELAGCARKTLRDWELKGYLHPKRITRQRVRWSRNELENFLCETAAEG